MVKNSKTDRKQSVTSSDKKPETGEPKKSKDKAAKTSKSKTMNLSSTKKADSKRIKKEVDKDSSKGKNRLVRRFNKLRLKGDSKGRGVIYIGHLPKGFEEAELRKFFE